MKLLPLLALAFIATTACGQTTQTGQAEQKVLPVQEYEKAINSEEDLQLVDVRSPQEYASGHLKGAININWFEKDKLDAAYAKLDKDRPIYLYCQSGNRSNKTYHHLKAKGYKVFIDLKGGFGAWSAAGKPVVR
jgi:rhodanese-related sulfurtransferase